MMGLKKVTGPLKDCIFLCIYGKFLGLDLLVWWLQQKFQNRPQVVVNSGDLPW